MPKQAKILITATILLALVYIGYNTFSQDKEENINKNIITEKEVNLSAEDRKFYEDRLADANQRLLSAQTNDERFEILVYKGQQLAALGKLAEARDTYWVAVSQNGSNASAYTSLGNVFVEMNDYEQAQQAYRRAIELRPQNADFWLRYIVFEKEKMATSKEVLNSYYLDALGKTTNNIDIITSYATWLEKVGDISKSIEYWQKAVELNPGNKALYKAEITRLQKNL
jgi:tetratricopeptide (TPR) repeat protein